MWLLYGCLTDLSVKSYACVVAESVICLQNYHIFETDADLNLIQYYKLLFRCCMKCEFFYNLVMISISRLHVANGK